MRIRHVCWLFALLANVLLSQQMPFAFVAGGPTNVQVIFQDHLGRLWVGGQSDVACFDGSRFYALRDFGFPTATGATAIAEDAEGAIWIGSEAGVFRFYRASIKQIMQGWVTSIAASSGVVLASAGPAGQGRPQQPLLYRIRRAASGWKLDPMVQLASGSPLHVSHTDTVLLPYKSGWGEARIPDIVAWHSGAELPVAEHESKGHGPKTFLRDRFGCVWSRSEDSTAYQCPGEPAPTELAGFDAAFLYSMAEDASGSMIFVNNEAIVTGRPGHFTATTQGNGVPDVDSGITAMDGTVWLGGANGIYRWQQPQRLEYWTPRDGANGTWSICRVGNRMFASNGPDGIAVLSDDHTRWLALPKTKVLGQVMSLMPDSKGGLWVGLRQGGVAEVSADGSITATAGLPAITTAKLVRTRDKQVWAVGIGIQRVTKAGNRILMRPEKLPDERPVVVDMEFAPNSGKLFACWEGGLLHKEADGWRKITAKDGLGEDRCRTLAVTANGDVWVGYATIPYFGLVRFDALGKVRVKDYASRWKGGATSACFLKVDSRGWLWRGTQEGLYVADSANAEKGLWTRLDEADGLPSSDTNQQGFYSDSDGSVWWLAADRSITHFRPPSDFVRPAFAPKIFISSFSWNGGAAKLADKVDDTPHGANITAHLGSLQFDRRNALRTRYRVLPGQTEWKEGHDLDVPLGVIGWGEHRLEVEASLGSGPWSQTAAHAFKVLRPFWATWPFLICLASAGMAAGFGGYRLEQRRREIERRALPDLAALRVDAVVPEANWLIGRTLDGRFVPKQVLALGGFATVFDGHDKKQDCRCAIKVFHREVADRGLAQRFAQEVASLEMVVHPNVVRIYGHGEAATGVPYLVMEFIEGETLREAIPPEGLPPAQVASLLRQAGDALAAIHAHGICHRDLKPDNLMIRGGQLVLIDFSIAIVKSPDKTVHGLSKAAGTIQYMAPEQAIGWADASSDIYSLAKVAMEMISGQRLSELLPEASRDLPDRVREYLAGLPLGLSAESIDLIGRALEFDPERRPRDAVAFAEKIAGDLEMRAKASASASGA